METTKQLRHPLYDEIVALAARFGFGYAFDLSDYPFIRDRLHRVPYKFAKTQELLPLDESEGFLLVALSDPLKLDALEELSSLVSLPIKEVLVPLDVLKSAIEICYHQKDHVATDLIASLSTEESGTEREESDGYDLLESKDDSSMIRMLNVILTEAIQQKTSDIHFEPTEEGMQVRYRIDGVLQMRHAFSREYRMQLTTRIKVMAKLDIAEHRLPQDGRIKLKMSGREIDFRVSTIPIVHGERIVLRILDKGNVVLGLNQLGMGTEILKEIRKMTAMTEGIILVTGPTGSGKTTTLYSALSEIDATVTNIMTIEDPVEYKIQGIAQIGVNPKIHLNFATGLRHILRQDPDVIMVGEIRDKETAEIAIQASLTGHLVISTLHTNDAPSAITRLVDMGIEPYLLSSSVVGVIAQRLLRTVCVHCAEEYIPSDEELQELGLRRDSLEGGVLVKAAGCDHCFHLGYKGRRGIYELMPMSYRLKQQIVQSADAVAIRQVALSEGMNSLRNFGADLVRQKKTTACEVFRVTRSLDESV